MARIKQTLAEWCTVHGAYGVRLAKEFTGIREDGVKVDMGSIGSRTPRRVLWKCIDCGNEWYACVNNRTTCESYCPECHSPGPSDFEKSLQYWCTTHGERGARLISEWVGLTENGFRVSMSNITYGATKRVKWRCSNCGNEWVAPVSYRVVDNRNCPECAYMYRGGGTISLGEWCRSNTNGEKIRRDWVGKYADGRPVNIEFITFASERSVQWKCAECGNEWVSRVCDRTLIKNSYSGGHCPSCRVGIIRRASAKTYIARGSSLADWCKNNKPQGDLLLKEWVGLDENDNPVDIRNVTMGSEVRLKWRCSVGHMWVATPSHRTNKGSNCPECFRIRMKQESKGTLSERSLQVWCDSHGERGNLIASQWTGVGWNNEICSMSDVYHGSKTEFYWECENGHRWLARVSDRTCGGVGCPYCSGHRVLPENSVAAWCGSNGDFGQVVKREWVGKNNKSGVTKAIDQVAASSMAWYMWHCSVCGNMYSAKVQRRLSNKTCCPECIKREKKMKSSP